MEDVEQAEHDEQIAIKIIGGFGQRNHYKDAQYAMSIDALLNELALMDATEIECAVVLLKKRNVKDVEDVSQDTFDIKGGVFGSELELTALHAILAARIRKFRAVVSEQLTDEGVVQ